MKLNWWPNQERKLNFRQLFLIRNSAIQSNLIQIVINGKEIVLNQQSLQKLNEKNLMDFQGHICLIYGPMFSGKSSQLLRRIRRYQHAKKNCLIINYMHDNRYSSEDVMATHDRQTHKALKTAKLNEIKEKAIHYDVVGIDEGQFFQDIVEFAEDLANRGVVVIVAALDATFQRKPFGNIINLVPLAEKVYKLTAVCVYCAQAAAFTLRTVVSQQIQLVGGEQSYKPVCRQCFNNPPQQLSKITSECSTIQEIEEKTEQLIELKVETLTIIV